MITFRSKTKTSDFNMNAKSSLTLLCGTPSRDGTFFAVWQLGIRETGHFHKLSLVGTNSIAAAKS